MSEAEHAPAAGARQGHRGYIGSRPVQGNRTPQHVQNLVIRDYAARHGLFFKLSATEYVMPGCYMMLEQVLDELPVLEGIIAYSLFMLPRRADRRHAVYRRVLDAEASLHFAVEGLSLVREADIRRMEEIWGVQTIIHRASHP